MHQRHNIVTTSGEAPCCAGHGKTSGDGDDHHHPATTTTTIIRRSSTTSSKPLRKRRKQQGFSFWPFAQRSSSSKSKYSKQAGSSSSSISNNPLALLDMDLLATLLQILSVLIMMGCAVTLMSRAISSSTGSSTDAALDEDATRYSSWFWGLLGLFSFGGGGGRSHGNRRSGAHPYGIGLNAQYPRVPLTPSSLYEIPGAMSHVGDKSDQYALLRKEIDTKMGKEPHQPVEQKLSFAPITLDNGVPIPYDIYNCPDEPPTDYPYAWNLLSILKAWPPDDPTPRPEIYQGLCVFDYTNEQDLAKAYKYRSAELPFVVRHDPQVQQAVQRWNTPHYLSRMLGNVRHRTEYSESNHFLYWNPPPRQRGQNRNRKNLNPNNPMKKPRSRLTQQQENTPQDWKQPTEMMRMTFDDWLQKADLKDDSSLGPDMPHWYFRLIGCGETGPEGQCDNGSSEYLFDELTFFQPKPSLYMVQPKEQKGIHCRFGMKGVIAENHFDGSRNAIVVLGGERRYILSHPEQCPFLSLLPKGHPSARHSAVDWSDPDLDAYPEFALAKGNEIVMQAGDVLYLPTNWFHYIISLSLNYQCNTRSGIGEEYMDPIHHCGF